MTFEQEIRAALVEMGSMTIFPGLVAKYKPRHALELGTGRGVNGALVMKVLPADSLFTTINLPQQTRECGDPRWYSGDEVAADLKPWAFDSRLLLILGNTVHTRVRDEVATRGVPVDLLYMDSCHTCAHLSREWELYRPLLLDGCLVVVDDLDQNDTALFLAGLRYDKFAINERTGVFLYVASTQG